MIPKRKRSGDYAFVAFTAVMGLLMTFWLAGAKHEAAGLKQAEAFNIAARDRINVISSALKDVASISHSLGAFFAGSDSVSRREFSIFATQILKDHPYIEALEWTPLVTDSERPGVEAQAMREVPGYAFKDIAEDGALVPAERKDIYYPVLFVAPIADYTERVLGADFMTEPVRRRAMEEAIRERGTNATAKLTLLSSRREGVLFFTPVYKAAKLEGFVISAISLSLIAAKAIEPLNKEGVNIIAYDITDGQEPGGAPLFTHASRLAPASEAEIAALYHRTPMQKTATVEVANRKWLLAVVPSPGFFETGFPPDLYPVIGLGTAFTLVLCYYMVSRIRENRRIASIVELRTQELEQLAHHDQLTGLPNRRYFLELLQKSLARAARSGAKVGVMYLDLNDFKPVNDTLGHAAGDLLLCEFARKAKKVLRDSDTLARLGGDEFAILLEDVQNPGDCEKIHARLRRTFGEKHLIAGQEVAITASIGTAVYPDDAATLDDLLAAADGAMYAAKRGSIGR